MIRINFRIFYFLFASSLTFAMNTQQKKHITSVACIDHDTVAIGTNQYCALVTNFSKSENNHITRYIHGYPVQNIIADKENQRLGIFGEKFFVVYDIKTTNKIWSQPLHSNNCSAAFCHIDDTIFLCDSGQLKSNKNIFMKLPYARSNDYFGIACHPKRKELLYPWSNRSLVAYSFKEKTYEQYRPNIMTTDIILRAFYSPDGDHIGIVTDTNKIFIYNTTNKSTVSVKRYDGSTYNNCINPLFVSHSHLLAFLCGNCKDLHYWNLITRRTIISEDNKDYDFLTKNPHALINRFDFSHDGSCMLYTGQKTAISRETSPEVMNFIRHQELFLRYRLLKIYSRNNENFLPLDIIGLLIQQLRALFDAERISLLSSLTNKKN